MDRIFKFLVFILLVEIILGYIIYIKNTTLLTGHYIAASANTVNKVINVFNFQKIKQNKEEKADENNVEEIENNKIVNQTNEENNLKQNINKCNKLLNKNQHIKLSGIESLKRKLEIQSDLEFLNSFNENEDYLVVILGNSETNGVYQNFENRLHTILQKNLRKKIQSKKIFVVNHSYSGGMISDHLGDLLTFTQFYEPDLAIFYSGGNELILTDKYEEITKENIIDKQKYLLLNFYKNQLILPNNIRHCLNQNNYLIKENFKRNDQIVDINNYIETNFKRIKESLIEKSIDFLFYIQPFSPVAPLQDNPIFSNYNKIKNLDIKESKYKNLNLTDVIRELIFVDQFHTRDAEIIAEIFLEDILNNYETKILEKIN